MVTLNIMIVGTCLFSSVLFRLIRLERPRVFISLELPLFAVACLLVYLHPILIGKLNLDLLHFILIELKRTRKHVKNLSYFYLVFSNKPYNTNTDFSYLNKTEYPFQNNCTIILSMPLFDMIKGYDKPTKDGNWNMLFVLYT